jgi:hypothetical protein
LPSSSRANGRLDVEAAAVAAAPVAAMATAMKIEDRDEMEEGGQYAHMGLSDALKGHGAPIALPISPSSGDFNLSN